MTETWGSWTVSEMPDRVLGLAERDVATQIEKTTARLGKNAVGQDGPRQAEFEKYIQRLTRLGEAIAAEKAKRNG